MRYNTGVALLFTGVIGVLCLSSWGAIHCYQSMPPTPSKPSFVAAQPQTVAPPAPNPAPVAASPAPLPAGRDLSTAEIRVKIDAWLAQHPDRHSQTKWVDILPDERFKATAVRFREVDAIKWSNNSSQWSQIRFDRNRDGIEDEKWLLLNGRTWRREEIFPDGSSKSTETFH